MYSNSTPTASRSRSPATTTSATVAESPLGILAAIASPSPTKTRPKTVSKVRSDSQELVDSEIEHSTDRSNAASSNPEGSKALGMDYKLSRPLNESNSESESPPASPSSQAVLRKGARILAERSKNSSENGEAAIKTPSHPSAIPATQLDVLALVTATSPPMPSRRRWDLHSTPRPAISDASDIKTPIRSSGKAHRPPRSASSSGNETVSEDEATLRTHSARLRSRYRSTQVGAIPSMPQLAVLSHRAEVVLKPLENKGNGSFSSGILAQQHNHARSSYKSQIKEAHQNNDQDLTESDEDMSSLRHTPMTRRTARHNFPKNGVAHQLHSSLDNNPRMPPASEPPLSRRSRRLLHSHMNGSALSNQLSRLTEESENTTDTGFHQIAEIESRDSPLSYSPLQSPSIRRSKQIRRAPGKRATAISGSETETDSELTPGHPGSETETDRSVSIQSRRSTTRAGFPQRKGDGGIYNRAAFPVPSLANTDYATNSGNQSNHSAGLLSRQRLHQLPYRQNEANTVNESSDGDATETDDEFFGPVHAIHSSIRPPQRVVRHLASLRTQNMAPMSLDFTGAGRIEANSGYASTNRANQLFTGHLETGHATSSGQRPSELGLGISSAENGTSNSSGLGPPRILSTPALAARPAIAAVVHGAAPSDRDTIERHSALQSYNVQPHYQHQETQHRPLYEDSNPLSNGAPYQNHSQNGPTQAPDDFTYKGAALRRLEKGTSSSRKRALTAPSSLDPPLRKRGQFGPNGRVVNSTTSLLEDENEYAYSQANRRAGTSSVGDSGSNTPNGSGSHHQSVSSNQGYILASSPVSSLRSSLVARSEQPRSSQYRSPALQTLDFPSTRLSFDTMRTGDQITSSNGRLADTSGPEESPAVIESAASNSFFSMDAAKRQSGKRRSSSVASTDSSSESKKNRLGAQVNHADASGSPRQSSDVLFPPIDSNTV